MIVRTPSEAVLLVDQLPDSRPVVIRERLHILHYVEILAFIVLLVLHMP